MLKDAPDTELTRLAVDYLRTTHNASVHFLSLRRALRRARALYGPSRTFSRWSRTPCLWLCRTATARLTPSSYSTNYPTCSCPRGQLPGHASELCWPQNPSRPPLPQGPMEAPAVVVRDAWVWHLHHRLRDGLRSLASSSPPTPLPRCWPRLLPAQRRVVPAAQPPLG